MNLGIFFLFVLESTRVVKQRVIGGLSVFDMSVYFVLVQFTCSSNSLIISINQLPRGLHNTFPKSEKIFEESGVCVIQ